MIINKFSFKNSRQIITISAVILLFFVLIKLFYIFYMTMRGNEHGFPFDTYLFNTPDRFVDFLITRIWSLEINPWDPNHPHLKSFIAAPYGPLTFDYLRLTAFLSPLIQFSILAIVFLFINYLIFKDALKNRQNFQTLLIYLSLLVGFFPLHFIIDRGNIEILPAVFLSAIFLFTPKSKYNYLLISIFLVIVASTKFVWIPIVFIILLYDFKKFLIAVILVAAVYSYPLIFDGVTIQGYISTITNSYNTSGRSLNWTHNIYHAIQVIGVYIGRPFDDSYVLFTLPFAALSLGIPYIYLLKLRYINGVLSLDLILLYICHFIISTMIFSNPSFDYRLIYLLPVFLYLSQFVVLHKQKAHTVIIIIICFTISSSWLNFYDLKSLPYYMPFRSLSILLLDGIIVFLILRSRKVIFLKKLSNY